MNLLFVIDSLGSGGAQRQMVTLAAGLIARGHSVEIFTYYDESHFADLALESGVKLHVHPKSSRYSFRPLFSIRRLIKNRNYDCVLAFLETPSIYAELALLGGSHTPLVVSERSCYSPASLGTYGRFKQELHRLATWITVNSFHQQRVMINMFPWMATRITAIWNGVDLEYFRPQSLPEVRVGLLRVQVLASLARKKNPLCLAMAVARCREKYGLRVYVDWAGAHTASPEGATVKREVDAFLLSSKTVDQWRWSGEMKDVRPLLAACDVVVHPSFAEGLPNAVCEALSSGRPVLASNIGDHPALINDGTNGALFDPSDPHDIAESLWNYAQLDETERESMALSARRFAETHLSTERFLSAYEDLFKVLSKGQMV